MRTRDKVSLALPPLLLRVMLAIIFIWAGLGKLRATDHVDPEAAATLANMGVLKPPAAPAADPNTPVTPLPRPSSADAPPVKPADEPPAGGSSGPSTRGPGLLGGTLGLATIMQSESAPTAPKRLATPPATTTPTPPTTTPDRGSATVTPAPLYAARDFPDGADTRRVNSLALGIHAAANPVTAADGSTPKPIWPKQLGTGRKPVYLAWAVTIVEIAGGGLLLIGLSTRLAALGIAGIMLGAMWLTQIGPAIASGKTVLGFLPAYSTYGHEWQGLLLQFALFIAASALFFAGPGLLAIDNAIFAPPKRSDDHDGE